MPARELLYGLSAESVAQATGVDLTTARRWKRSGRCPEPVRRLLVILVTGNLGMIAPSWKGWCLADRVLCGPDGLTFTPADVLSLPYVTRALEAQRQRQRFAVQGDWVDGKYNRPDETHAGPNFAQLRKRG